ncbi:MAG: 2,4-dienoyl-CoA reductase [Bdellovibrionales bacterium GWA2_49_15]|nr:MAG: 2,4-dienoyl-CoA reductase [Bdellovibrionales bacterium GWA2_49_15]HAZ13039.1 2,4-dienoyl-CoA reductase [Bdellovibrionales bacterium]
MTFPSIFKTDLFLNKVILITGGGSGLGRCMAQELAHLGATVFIAGRTEEKLKRTVEEVTASGGKADWAVCDIREEQDVQNLVQTILARHKNLHGLVNNAGGQFPCPLEEISKNGWEAVVKNNLTGAFLVSKEVLRQAFRQNGGAIVNILADNRNGMPMMGHSGAARAGVENLTKTAAVEWAKYKVRVNAISPGIIESSGLETYDEKFKKIMKFFKPRIPLKRFGIDREVSAAVVFLLSPASSFITGVNLQIDGGSTLTGLIPALEDYAPNLPFDQN